MQVLALQAIHTSCPSVRSALNALDTLEASVSLAQHHDAVSGTAKQHVANDYARRIAIGFSEARSIVASAISHLVFDPMHCPGTRAEPRTPSNSAKSPLSPTSGVVTAPQLPSNSDVQKPNDSSALTAPQLEGRQLGESASLSQVEESSHTDHTEQKRNADVVHVVCPACSYPVVFLGASYDNVHKLRRTRPNTLSEANQ